MANLTARFVADFAPFSAAVQQAEVELKGLETSSASVEKSLNRMVDQFSGRKLIQDANLMAEAVERVGGASKLTEKELASIGARASEAVQKMESLGLDVPQRLQDLAAHAKDGAGALDRMGVAVGTFIGNFASGLLQRGIDGVLGLGTAAFETASQINTLSQRLGVSAEMVQGLSHAAGQTGTSIDTFAAAITKLNLNLAEGDKSTINALKALGIEYETIMALSPDERILALGDALKGVEDPLEQVRIGTELMGKGFVEMVPAVASGLRDLVDETEGMSNDTVQRLAEAQDAWQEFYEKIVIVTGNIIAEILSAGPKLADAMDRLGPTDTLIAALRARFALLTGDWSFVADAADNAADVIDGSGVPALERSGDAAARARQSLRELEAQQREQEKAAKEQAEANKKAADELARWSETFAKVTAAATPWQEVLATSDDQLNEWIQSLLRAGVSVQDIATAYSVSTGLVEANSRALKENDDTLKAISRTYDDLGKLTDEYNRLVQERTMSTVDKQIAEITRWVDATKGKLMERNTLTNESEAMIDAIATERINKLMVNEDTLHRHRIDNLQNTAQVERNTLQDMLDAEVGTYTPQVIAAQQQKVRAAEEAAGEFADTWNEGFKRTADGAKEESEKTRRHWQEAAQEASLSWSEAMDLVRQGKGEMSGTISGGGPGSMVTLSPWGRQGGGLSSTPTTVPWGSPEHQAYIAKMAAQGRYFGPVETRGPHPAYPGYESGGANIIGPDWGALGMGGGGGAWEWNNAPPRAIGGPVKSGEPYLVGERGPELFLPNADGTILPNESMLGPNAGVGGSSNLVMHNTFNVNGTGQDIARTVMAEITRLMRVGRKWPAV